LTIVSIRKLFLRLEPALNLILILDLVLWVHLLKLLVVFEESFHHLVRPVLPLHLLELVVSQISGGHLVNLMLLVC
jgi:hypothetical protein